MVKSRLNIIMIAGVLAVTSAVYAIDKKPVNAINTDQLIRETQISASSSDNQMNLVWWIPCEFWQGVFSNDKMTPEAQKEQIINTLKPYSLVMVCQADISNFGTFGFYNKAEIGKNLGISYKTPDGNVSRLIPLNDADIPADLKMMLEMLKPMFTAAAGNMGQNMHFFVLKDYDSAGGRKLDPYRFGTLDFRLGSRSAKTMQVQLELPLNSLCVPRICPNGKEAHVTWKYCPWTGQKLKD